MADKSEIGNGLDDNKMNNKFISTLANNKKSSAADGEDVKEIPHDKPASNGKYEGPMDTDLMTWTDMLESMDEISSAIDQQGVDEISNSPLVPNSTGMDGDMDQELLNELDQVFTPVLVMQGMQSDMSDNIQAALEESSLLVEQNIIKFDDQTRMAQLIAVCALLLSRKKNTDKYQMYRKAAAIKNQMKLDIQKEEYAAAKALAQKYLVKVSTSNNSSVARDAAKDLLPETQH